MSWIKDASGCWVPPSKAGGPNKPASAPRAVPPPLPSRGAYGGSAKPNYSASLSAHAPSPSNGSAYSGGVASLRPPAPQGKFEEPGSRAALAPVSKPAKPMKPSKPSKPAKVGNADSTAKLGKVGATVFSEAVRRNSNGNIGGRAEEVVRRKSIDDGLTSWLMPKDRPQSTQQRRPSNTPPLLGVGARTGANRSRKTSVVGWDYQSTLQFQERDFAGAEAASRAAEIATYINDEHKELFTNHSVFKEGTMTKYNRAGDTSRPHFFLTETHLIMADHTTLSRAVKFRQVFKLTDMKVSSFDDRKMRFLTPVKSFECGFAKIVDCQSWFNTLKAAIEKARRAANLPSNYEETLELSPMWGANTTACEICRRNFTVLVRRHHCR